jgi:ribosomal protein S18 acetylase RimI-like enzyme
MDMTDGTRYQIRPATREDIGELMRMQMALQRSMTRVGTNMLRLRQGSTGRLCEYYQTQIDDAMSQVFVAQPHASKDVVGMGSGRIWLHADYVPKRSGELIDLWVDPEHRRQGLAGRLVARLLKFFRANGIEFLAVNYVQGNPLAEILWKRFGFRPVLMTATAERRAIETALGVGSQRIVPMDVHPVADDRRVYAGVSVSG